MKTFLFFTLLFITLLGVGGGICAQNKAAYLDRDYLMSLMPGINNIDTQLNQFERDSLSEEYSLLTKRLNRMDSLLWNKHELFVSPVLQKQGKAEALFVIERLQNWQSYSANRLRNKREQLLQPYNKAIDRALAIVALKGNYSYIFKKQQPANTINLLPFVLEELHVAL